MSAKLSSRKGIWFRDYINGGVWEYTTIDSYVKLNECIQELLLWLGENSFEANRGVDYFNIFNSSRFITDQVENVIASYKQYFKNLEVTPINLQAPKVLINIDFYFFDEININGKSKNAIKLEVSYDRDKNNQFFVIPNIG